VGDICRVGEVCTLLHEVTKAPEVWRSVQFVLKEPEVKPNKDDLTRAGVPARWGRTPNLFVLSVPPYSLSRTSGNTIKLWRNVLGCIQYYGTFIQALYLVDSEILSPYSVGLSWDTDHSLCS
jgi:hypothetical protein